MGQDRRHASWVEEARVQTRRQRWQTGTWGWQWLAQGAHHTRQPRLSLWRAYRFLRCTATEHCPVTVLMAKALVLRCCIVALVLHRALMLKKILVHCCLAAPSCCTEHCHTARAAPCTVAHTHTSGPHAAPLLPEGAAQGLKTNGVIRPPPLARASQATI